MTFYRNKKGFVIFHLSLLVGCLFSACQMFWSPHSPKGYVMPRPKKMILDKKVNEISGLFYLSEKEGLLAIADDKQKLYRLTTGGKVEQYFDDDIGKGATDYEDVAMVDNTVYILVSKGSIKEIKKTDSGLVTTVYPVPVTGENDFETLYYDPTASGLIILCKKCEAEKGQNIRTAYRFDLSTNFFYYSAFY